MFEKKANNLVVYVFFVVLLIVLSANSWALEVYVPHITTGEDDWEDTLIVDNCDSANQTFNVIYYDQGRILQNATYGVNAYEYNTKSLKSLQPAASCAVISYESPALNFRLSYRYLSTNATTEFNLPNSDGSATVIPTFANLRFLFPRYSPVVQWAGMAIMNTTDTIAYVTMYAIGNGTVISTKSDSIPAKGRLVGTLEGWFPTLSLADIAEVEKVEVVSDAANLNGITISGDDDNHVLLFTTAVPYQ